MLADSSCIRSETCPIGATRWMSERFESHVRHDRRRWFLSIEPGFRFERLPCRFTVLHFSRVSLCGRTVVVDAMTAPLGLLSRITIFPIKSFPGVDVDACRILPSGALEWDRRLALIDAAGDFVNAKSSTQLHQFQATFDLSVPSVGLSVSGHRGSREFHLDDDLESLGDYLSCLLNQTVRVAEDVTSGFPDDLEAGGPTIIAMATLQEIAALFGTIPLDEMRRRFRTNLEISSVPSFWEDSLYGEVDAAPVPFQIGRVTLGGVRPCRRCAVPGRNPETAEVSQAFAKVLAMFRKVKLPPGTPGSHFIDYYRLATNTVLIDAGDDSILRVGDPVRLM